MDFRVGRVCVRFRFAYTSETLPVSPVLSLLGYLFFSYLEPSLLPLALSIGRTPTARSIWPPFPGRIGIRVARVTRREK